MIEISSLSKTFNPGTSNEIKALKDVNVKIEKNDYLIIVGANGSGKSTLLNAIAGSFFVDKGSIKINGIDVTRKHDFERSKWIARIFQNPLSGTAPDLSILDNFRLAAIRTKPKYPVIGINNNFIQQIKEKVAILGMGLEDKLKQPMGTLSGGQRQALTLIMAIVDDADILLLDEPIAALDPKSSETLMTSAEKIISEFKLTAILVTHQLKDAHRYGNRIIQMKEGQIVLDLKAKEKAQLSLNNLFEWFA